MGDIGAHKESASWVLHQGDARTKETLKPWKLISPSLGKNASYMIVDVVALFSVKSSKHASHLWISQLFA